MEYTGASLWNRQCYVDKMC